MIAELTHHEGNPRTLAGFFMRIRWNFEHSKQYQRLQHGSADPVTPVSLLYPFREKPLDGGQVCLYP
jgi:hypothetical protein